MEENSPIQRPDSTDSPERVGVATLRAHWDPVADTFPKHLRFEGICARMYRAFSWLERVEQLEEREGMDSADDQLIFSWTALNSLYGRWDPERQEPASDIQCLKQFFDDLFEIDEEARLARFLEQSRDAVMAVFDNQFLVRQFWNAPDLVKADKTAPLRHKARSWYIEKRYSLMLEKLVLNIYYLRCQLIHGAATRGSSLNRDTVGQCLRAFRLLLPPTFEVIIEHGKDWDWGMVCYPVVK